jgi:hypothetical protein
MTGQHIPQILRGFNIHAVIMASGSLTREKSFNSPCIFEQLDKEPERFGRQISMAFLYIAVKDCNTAATCAFYGADNCAVNPLGRRL